VSNLEETIKQGARGAAVRHLQTALNAVGAALVVDGDFGENTDEAVRDFQAWQHLVEDGVVGPKTWFAINQSLARRQHMDNVAKSDRLRVLGEKAVETALMLWELDIEDPKADDKSKDAQFNREQIEKFIHNGCAWRHEEYTGDGDFEWCLAFAWYCWPEIKDSIRTIYAASTYRTDRYAAYRSAFGEPNPAPELESDRRLYMQCDEKTRVEDLPWVPRPGDIALVGNKGYGSHGVLIESVDIEEGCIYTVEGNSHGKGPNGERQQGVVRNAWYFGSDAVKSPVKGWHVRRVVRPGLDSLKP
jgi:hypothetical protein